MNKPNVDNEELQKFAVHAANWWDLGGEFSTLHRINPLRLNYIAAHSGGLYGKKVLDVGCGGGILAEAMALENAHVTGLDLTEAALQVARLHAAKTGIAINYLLQTVEQHADEHTACYDVVTCMEMLEHVPDPQSIVKACASLVKPGGVVFFSTLNRNFKTWLLAIVAAEHILRWLPRGTHDIKKCIRPAELLSWIDKTPLEAINMVGVNYSPLTRQFRLGSNVDVNYMMSARRS